MLGAPERWFAVDHPVMAEQLAEPGGKDLGLSELIQIAIEAELSFAAGALQGSYELTAKNPAQYLDGKKERVAGMDPVGVIQRQPTGSDDTVDMGMNLQLLVPGMQHTEEADFCPQMSGIAGDFEKRFCTGSEQQIIDDLFVLQSQRRQLGRQSENDMHVGRGEKFAAPCLKPVFAGTGLTLRAMPVSATVIRDGGAMSTAGALIDMTAECGGATARNGQQDLDMGPADPLAVALEESCSGRADQVGHLQKRPAHELCLRPPCAENVSASSGLAVALRCRWERCR